MQRARVYGKILVILALGVLWAGPGQAQGDAVAEIARQTPKRIEEFQDLAKGIAQGRPVRLEEFENLARDLANREQKRVKGQAEEMAPSPPPAGNRMLLFITLGDKPEEDLEDNRRLLQAIKEISPEAVLVLRGLPKGSRSLGDLFKYIAKLSDKDSKTGPSIMLNPVLFRQYGVTVSPTLVYERDGAAVAWARGIVNSHWLRRRVEQDKAAGDLGKWGETVTIAERDFVEEMKSRLAGIDWEAKKEQAEANYWKKQKFLDLPKAKEEKVFYLDAVYQVEKDFILPDGKVVARAGQKIDLFKIMPPTFVLVVFNAADPKQVEWALKAGKEHADKRVKYITTTIPDREHGWNSLSRLQGTLETPVYLLKEPVRDRFKLEHVPSTVQYAKAKHKFEVKEYQLFPSDGAGPGPVQAATSEPPLLKGGNKE